MTSPFLRAIGLEEECSPSHVRQTSFSLGAMSGSAIIQWKYVVSKSGTESVPRQRSLHTGVVVGDALYIFGGYDGTNRLNDLHRFDFTTCMWTQLVASNGLAPSPRDRVAAASYRDALYVFGGYDGANRVNDMWRFDTNRYTWQICEIIGLPPSARHSHSVVEYDGKIFVLFGYDGNYKADIHEYSIARKTWVPIQAKGQVPRPRYRTSVVAHNSSLIVFGGHDGLKHLDDLNIFDLKTNTWTLVEPVVPMSSMGPYAFRTITPSTSSPPAHRDSHSAVVQGDSMFVFGGSTGVARNDLYEYRIDLNTWIEIESHTGSAGPQESSGTQNPCPRFCHVAVAYKDCMYIHAGYDGQNRLGDFRSYSFIENVVLDVPPPTILEDIKTALRDKMFTDISFQIGDDEKGIVRAHKAILAARCPYFKAMFDSGMAERTQNLIKIHDVSLLVFEAILGYLYSDQVDDTQEVFKSDPMAIFTAADRFGIERLKRICEQSILSSISIDNACFILQAADMVGATMLRKRSIEFVVRHYDAIVKTTGFEEMARRNIELTLEIIRLR